MAFAFHSDAFASIFISIARKKGGVKLLRDYMKKFRINCNFLCLFVSCVDKESGVCYNKWQKQARRMQFFHETTE